MSAGKVVLGVLVGAAAGALLGVLFAPDKGEKTREMLSKKGGDLTDDLQGKYDEFVKTVTKKLGLVQNEVSPTEDPEQGSGTFKSNGHGRKSVRTN